MSSWLSAVGGRGSGVQVYRARAVRSAAVLDAVLFDLDGTLTDPEEGIVGSFRHAMEVVGHPVAEGVDLRWMIGPAIRDNFTRHGIPDHLHDEAVVAFRARHVEVGLFQAELIVGVMEVLDALVADGIPLALATAKPVPQAVTTLEHFDLADQALLGFFRHDLEPSATQ